MNGTGGTVSFVREPESSPIAAGTAVPDATGRGRFLKTIWLVIVINLFALVFGSIVENSLNRQKEKIKWQARKLQK